MTPPATLLLDNEAVQALMTAAHPKHRRALAFLDVVNRRGAQRAARPRVVVPTAVRVEAGWNRREPRAALVNRLTQAVDRALDPTVADQAERLRRQAQVSTVDAALGEAMQALPQPVAVLTSDEDDVRRLAELMQRDVRVARI